MTTAGGPIDEPLTLKDGSTALVELTSGAPCLLRSHESQHVDRLELDLRSAGVGGFRLWESPGGQQLVVGLFSGQSEEGYQLIGLGSGLQHVASQPYVFGECASYAWSPSEQLLAMAYPFACGEWWLGFDEDSEVQDDGSYLFNFGAIRIRDATSGASTTHLLQVQLPSDWQEGDDGWDSELAPAFDTEDELVVNLPWAQVRLRLPLGETLIVPPPVRGGSSATHEDDGG